MAQPPSFVHPQKPTVVCLLKKALYGLKQAPQAWFSQLRSQPLEIDFIASKADSSLFLFKSANVRLLALVCVDDIILTSSSMAASDGLIKTLSTDFPIKNLGALSYFSGFEVSRIATGLHFSQQRYIFDLLQCTNMTMAKPINSPMSASTSFNKFDGLSMADPTLYRSMVGALQYLAITRLNIAFLVNKRSQFMHESRDVHWAAVKRILRYFKVPFLMVSSSVHVNLFSSFLFICGLGGAS